MKKILCISLLGFSALATAAQPVTDSIATNQLRLITSQLETISATLAQNQQKTFTCTDGEKTYTAGLIISRKGWQYKCVLKGNHTEWEQQPELTVK